jgi:ATP-GRASP peptide maturase of grasp-with-spasm system
MILILSKKNHETSTESVMDWLNFLGGKYKRLNGGDFLFDCNLILNNEGFFFKDIEIPLDKIEVIWNRRWLDEDFIFSIMEGAEFDMQNTIEINMHLSKEINVISKFFFQFLKDKKWLSAPEEMAHNKLEVLSVASKYGLKTPFTIVTTRKSELIKLRKEKNRIISKNISDPAMFFTKTKSDEDILGFGYSTKTIEVDDELIEQVSDSFFPSLFQELVNKDFEIRVFYLDGNFYSMAIFSQLDEKTMIDFRNYDTIKPIRYIPYTLPSDIEGKLRKLIQYFNYTTGSIDIVKSIEGEYFFLEFNPVGQFGMTSKPCNYYLEKKIAEYLINQDV